VLQYWKNNYDPLPDNAPRILNDSTLAFTSNFKNWKNHYTVASIFLCNSNIKGEGCKDTVKVKSSLIFLGSMAHESDMIPES